jgi:ATP-dependent protease ClpP protease subunit
MSKVLNFKDVKNVDRKFQMRSKRKDKKYAELVLYGEIGQDFWGEGITAQSVNEAFKEFGDVEQLDVRINSMGGSVFDGVTIYNRIKQLGANTTVYIDGLAASIASIIAMAGDEVVISEGSVIMVHSPMVMTMGNAQDHENAIEILDTIEEEMIGIYARKTDLSRSELRKMLKTETWINSEEAIEMGFATSTSEDALMVACSEQVVANYSKYFKNMPREKIITDKAVVKNKLDAINKKIEGYLAR